MIHEDATRPAGSSTTGGATNEPDPNHNRRSRLQLVLFALIRVENLLFSKTSYFCPCFWG